MKEKYENDMKKEIKKLDKQVASFVLSFETDLQKLGKMESAMAKATREDFLEVKAKVKEGTDSFKEVLSGSLLEPQTEDEGKEKVQKMKGAKKAMDDILKDAKKKHKAAKGILS